MLSADLCNKEVKDSLSTLGRRAIDLKIISFFFFKISFSLQNLTQGFSLYYSSLTQAVILALIWS